jgi:hypothetical protein
MSDETNEVLPDDFTSQVEPTPTDTPETKPEEKPEEEEPKKPEEKNRTVTVP